jgi:hypothetical protein
MSPESVNVLRFVAATTHTLFPPHLRREPALPAEIDWIRVWQR